jgi:hypothetical protein
MISKSEKITRIKLSEAKKKFGATDWNRLIQKQRRDAATNAGKKPERH